jgi:hypothetical protein
LTVATPRRGSLGSAHAHQQLLATAQPLIRNPWRRDPLESRFVAELPDATQQLTGANAILTACEDTPR